MSYLKRAEQLEEEARMLRKLHQVSEDSKKLISVGCHIIDLDANKVAKVTRLKNGSNDFEASYLDGSYSRGYHFVVKNWRIATVDEVEYHHFYHKPVEV
jgi:hypothetical protein